MPLVGLGEWALLLEITFRITYKSMAQDNTYPVRFYLRAIWCQLYLGQQGSSSDVPIHMYVYPIDRSKGWLVQYTRIPTRDSYLYPPTRIEIWPDNSYHLQHQSYCCGMANGPSVIYDYHPSYKFWRSYNNLCSHPRLRPWNTSHPEDSFNTWSKYFQRTTLSFLAMGYIPTLVVNRSQLLATAVQRMSSNYYHLSPSYDSFLTLWPLKNKTGHKSSPTS